MPRGEGSKADLRSAGVAIGAAFGVVCLAALTCVASTTQSCSSCAPIAFLGAPTTSEPFAGASDAASELGWRDAARARRSFGAPMTSDAAEASRLATELLRARGYVEHTPAGSPRELPFEATLGELEGACGVALVVAEGTGVLGATHVRGGVASAGHALPIDTSVAAIGACGAATLEVSGVGQATLRVLSMPGLTADDVLRSELPADVVLAHAEAEVLLGARGYTPADWIDVVPLGGAASSGAFFATVPRAPSSGCTIWVGVAIGAGRSESSWSGILLAQDHAPDRALAMSVACSGSTSRISVYDDATPGATLYWRAYGGGSSGGPLTPGGATTVAPTAARVRVGTGSDALPPAIPGG